MSGSTDSKRIADEARERLTAELDRTLESFEESLARAEQFVANLDALRNLSTELLERATELHREVERLAGLAGERTLPRPPPQTPLDVIDSVRESIAETPIDFGHRRRRFEAPAQPRAEDSPATDEIADGVRVFVEQLRIAGEDDVAIARHLEGIGVENPASVVTRIAKPEGSLTS